MVNRADELLAGKQAELDALLLDGTQVTHVVSAKLDYAEALTSKDIKKMDKSLNAQFHRQYAVHMTQRRSRAFGDPQEDAVGVRFIHEGGSMPLEDFQARYRRAPTLQYVGLTGRPDARTVPLEESGVAAAGQQTTRLVIGQMAGLSRAQLRRLLTDEIALILDEPASTVPPGMSRAPGHSWLTSQDLESSRE